MSLRCGSFEEGGQGREREHDLTIGVCGSVAIQLPFLCAPKLLQGEVKHLPHNSLLRPRDPITVILWRHPAEREEINTNSWHKEDQWELFLSPTVKKKIHSISLLVGRKTLLINTSEFSHYCLKNPADETTNGPFMQTGALRVGQLFISECFPLFLLSVRPWQQRGHKSVSRGHGQEILPGRDKTIPHELMPAWSVHFNSLPNSERIRCGI